MSLQDQVGQLPAFKDDLLLHLLDEVGLRDRYEERKLRCFACNQNLAEIEVGVFLNRNGLMEPVCTAPECFNIADRLIMLLNEEE